MERRIKGVKRGLDRIGGRQEDGGVRKKCRGKRRRKTRRKRGGGKKEEAERGKEKQETKRKEDERRDKRKKGREEAATWGRIKRGEERFRHERQEKEGRKDVRRRRLYGDPSNLCFPPPTLTSLTSCSARLQTARGGKLIHSAKAPPVHTKNTNLNLKNTRSDSATVQHLLTNHSLVGGATRGVHFKNCDGQETTL